MFYWFDIQFFKEDGSTCWSITSYQTLIALISYWPSNDRSFIFPPLHYVYHEFTTGSLCRCYLVMEGIIWASWLFDNVVAYLWNTTLSVYLLSVGHSTNFDLYEGHMFLLQLLSVYKFRHTTFYPLKSHTTPLPHSLNQASCEVEILHGNSSQVNIWGHQDDY